MTLFALHSLAEWSITML